MALGKQNLSTVCPKDNKYSNYNYMYVFYVLKS